MCSILIPLFSALLDGLKSRLALQAEILALQHQIIILNRSSNRPRLRAWDRLLWTGLLRFWLQWRSALIIVVMLRTGDIADFDYGSRQANSKQA